MILHFWVLLDVQTKYIWKSIISILKYCTLHETHFALHIDNHIFYDFSYEEYSLFFRFAGG